MISLEALKEIRDICYSQDVAISFAFRSPGVLELHFAKRVRCADGIALPVKPGPNCLHTCTISFDMYAFDDLPDANTFIRKEIYRALHELIPHNENSTTLGGCCRG